MGGGSCSRMAAIKLAWSHGWVFKENDAPTQGWEVYANRQLEQALNNRLGGPASDAPRVPPPFGPEGRSSPNMLQIVPLVPSPADALKQLGREIDSSIRFYEPFSGPFPRCVDTHLASVVRQTAGVIQRVDGAHRKLDVALRVDVVRRP